MGEIYKNKIGGKMKIKKQKIIKVFLFLFSLSFLIFADPIWVARYNGPANRDDIANAIAVDDSGNIYVTGTSWRDSTGVEHYDYLTIKYNPNGDILWVRTYNGPGDYDDIANAIALDKNGNIYVTGLSFGDSLYPQYVTIKYDSNGDILWIKRYGYGTATAIAVDSLSNVYVTGTDYSLGERGDYVTIKYNSNGDILWVKRYNGPANDWDEANAIVVDNEGNVYVIGKSKGLGTSFDYATIKYNSEGVEEWVARYNGSGNGGDIPTGIAVDSNGNVYVTGFSLNSDSNMDYVTIKYNPQGMEEWIAIYNGPANFKDEAYAIRVDKNDNIYVTGRSGGYFLTIKYNPNGDTLWIRRYSSNSGQPSAMVVDDSGNVYITGRCLTSTDWDYLTIKYNSSGILEWAEMYSGPSIPADSRDSASAIAIDNNGYVYVTGKSYDSITAYDCATIKYRAIKINEKMQNRNTKLELHINQNLSLGKLKINFNGSNLSIFDVSGRKIYSLKRGLNSYIISSSGIYFISSKSQKKVIVLNK
jgi:uncharacterized delta-60 repeat protein